MLAVVALSVVACREEPPRPRPEPPAAPALRPAGASEVYAPTGGDDGSRDAYPVRAAFSSDPAYASDELVPVHRLVYRVRLAVPRSLGVAPATFPLPAAELYLDVGRERLRARFVGDGWPVPAGSEVRVRLDQPGAYVFDGDGGHPLGPGQLATWFEGGRLRREPSVRIRATSARDQPFHSELLCRFIAEWARQPPDALMRRCGPAGAPSYFRVGLWRAQRTADVSVELPRSNLRADHEGTHPSLSRQQSRSYLSPEQLRALPPRPHGVLIPQSHPMAPPADGLTIFNRGVSRAIITAQGVPIGWVDAGQSVHFEGLDSGIYAVGAMRPLGLQTSQKHNVAVPAAIRVPY